MFRGLQPTRSRIAYVNIVSNPGPSRGSRVLKLQFSRTNTAMAVADGAAGATAKTLRMENVRGLHLMRDLG